MYKEPGNLTNVQLALHYFTQLNPFPSKKCINDNLDKLDSKYDKILNLYYMSKINYYQKMATNVSITKKHVRTLLL